MSPVRCVPTILETISFLFVCNEPAPAQASRLISMKIWGLRLMTKTLLCMCDVCVYCVIQICAGACMYIVHMHWGIIHLYILSWRSACMQRVTKVAKAVGHYSYVQIFACPMQCEVNVRWGITRLYRCMPALCSVGHIIRMNRYMPALCSVRQGCHQWGITSRNCRALSPAPGEHSVTACTKPP